MPNIYDELLEMIEGLPHSIKVPLRQFIKQAQKKDELLGLYREQKRQVAKSTIVWFKLEKQIEQKEKELEGK